MARFLFLQCRYRIARWLLAIGLIARQAVIEGSCSSTSSAVLVLLGRLDALLCIVLCIAMSGRTQVDLKILDDIRLPILEVVRYVCSEHAHLTVTLAIGSCLTLIWHHNNFSPQFRAHRDRLLRQHYLV